MRRNEIRRNPQRILKGRHCGLITILSRMDAAQVETRFRRVARRSRRLAERRDRFIELSLFCQSYTEVQVRSGHAGIEFDGAAKMAHAALHVTLFGEQLAVICVRIGVVRVKPERGFEMFFRLWNSPLLRIEIAEIVMRHAVVGIDFDRSQGSLKRFADPSLF